ncbi:MAG: phosphatase PAP2 family protein [Clostridia bacterium]|nr:phosphatase PAP2 family protein [Clostridia bacterium]
MSLLYWIESWRTPWLDAFFSVITELGGEVFFMAVAIIFFWCSDKGKGYYVLTVGFVGTLLNQFLKLLFRVPRPWVKDPNFTIVESARAEATGYSFPSGHTQNAAATLGCTAMVLRKKALKILFWVLYALVAFSRMYLGVHTPMDVGVSLVLGLAMTIGLYPLFRDAENNPRRIYALLGGMVGLGVLFILFVEMYRFPEDVDADNLLHGVENAYKLTGAVTGMLLAYWLDQRYIHFDVKAPVLVQVIKCALGLALVMGVRVVLKAPLNALIPYTPVAGGLRYMLMVLFAAAVWPLTFPWWKKICKC